MALTTERKIEGDAQALVRLAEELTISTPEEAQIASDLMADAAAVLREIDRVFGPIVAKAHATHKEAVRQRDALRSLPMRATTVVKKALGDWHQKQEVEHRRAVAEAEAMAREEARARAAVDAEAKATRADEIMRQAEQAADPAERERLAGRAEELIESAEVEARDAIENALPVALPERPRVAGVAVRKSYDFEITDARRIRAEYLMPNALKIRQVVRALGPDATEAVGGIRVFEKRVVARTGA